MDPQEFVHFCKKCVVFELLTLNWRIFMEYSKYADQMEKRGTFQTFLHTKLMVELENAFMIVAMEMLGHHSRRENVGFQKASRFCG